MCKHHPDEVTLVTTGEGTTSQGEFWESLNTASMAKLPVVYLVEDNGYAISTPVKYQTPGGNISHLLKNFPDFYIEECDGTDLLASYAAMRRAVELRPLRHAAPPWCTATSSAPTRTRSPTTRGCTGPRASSRRTPSAIPFRASASSSSTRASATPPRWRSCTREVDAEVQAASDAALEAALPEPSSYALHVYSEELKPTATAL